MKLEVVEQWDTTLFYLATLSVVFFAGWIVRSIVG